MASRPTKLVRYHERVAAAASASVVGGGRREGAEL